MSTTTTAPASAKVVTGIVRFSYAHVWEPKAVEDGGEKKYSVSILIPKTDKVTLAKVKAAIELAKTEGLIKLGGKIPANLKTPLRDGDIDRPEDANYEGMMFINANAKTQPGIVDATGAAILRQDDFYSGCFGRASITFFAYAGKSKGIAAGLNHVMKTKDGEPLGGRSTAESDFAEVLVADDDLM